MFDLDYIGYFADFGKRLADFAKMFLALENNIYFTTIL